jgi:hypothetical protein
MKLINITRTLHEHVNHSKKQSYICILDYQKSDVLQDWLDDEATENIFISDYLDGDENLPLDVIIEKSKSIK